MNYALKCYRRLGLERIEDRVMLSAAPPAAHDFLLPDFHVAGPMSNGFAEVSAHVAESGRAGVWPAPTLSGPQRAGSSALPSLLHERTAANSPTRSVRVGPAGESPHDATSPLPAPPGLGGLPARGSSAMPVVPGSFPRPEDYPTVSTPGPGIDFTSAVSDLPQRAGTLPTGTAADSARQPEELDTLMHGELPAAKAPSSDGGLIGIDQPSLRTRAFTLSADRLHASATVSGTVSSLNATNPDSKLTLPRAAATESTALPSATAQAATAQADDATPSRATPSARSQEIEAGSKEPADAPAPSRRADNDLPFFVDSEPNRPSDDRLTAISPSDLVVEEPEGGFIDVTDLAGETVRLDRQAAAEPQVADGAAPAGEEAWTVDGLRGRFQVFELALADGSVPRSEEVQPVPRETPPSEAPEARLTSLQPPAEHEASYPFRARDEALAQLADEPAQRRDSAKDDVRWSLSRISLFGGAVIGLHAAERNAQAAMAADRQPVFITRTSRIG